MVFDDWFGRARAAAVGTLAYAGLVLFVRASEARVRTVRGRCRPGRGIQRPAVTRGRVMNPVNTGVGGSGSEAITALGVFPDYAAAHRAVEALRRAGYRDEQIGVLGPDEAAAAREKRSGLKDDPTHTRWEEGAGVGAAAGGLAGLGLGAAIAAGLMSPLGPVVAGGWLVAVLASAGTGAAVGGAVGALAGLGVPEEDARWYASELEGGRVVVTVRGDATGAGEILHAHAAARPPSGTATYGNALPATPY